MRLQERAWTGLFDEAQGDLAARLPTEPFMRGSFGYHYHGSSHHVTQDGRHLTTP